MDSSLSARTMTMGAGGLVPPSSHVSSSPSLSPSPSTDLSLPTSTSAASSDPGTRDEPDPTIIEALNSSKDRLFVLKLGDDFDSLLNERGTPGKRCTYVPPSSYQRMLVHRCAQYYKLLIEADAKTISVMLGPESRAPKSRISEIVPMEQAPAPAFKIMRRNVDERARAKQPGRADSTGDDQPDGTAPSEDLKRRAQMTIEERTAAYNQARSRIFEGFQEKDDPPSTPPTRRDSANSEPRWVDKQRRSDLSSSSRGSPAPQDMTTIPASYYPPMLFNPNAPSAPVHSPQQYEPNATQPPPVPYMYGPQYYPMYAYYPQPQYDPRQGPAPGMQMYAPPPPPPQGVAYPFPPQHAATWPPPIQSQPQPQPQTHPETQRHAFPPMPPPPQPGRHMHVQNDPFPPHQYMQPYQYAGYMHQPVLVPTPPDAPGSGHSSRSGSRNGHSGHASNGSNGGAKGPRAPVGPWGAPTLATPMRVVTGPNRRLSTSSSSTSAYSGSGGGAGSGSRTPADETASIASSASSSSSRRTYTSTSTTSKHPLPARPDWAVGLMAEPNLSRTTSTSSTDSRLRMTSRSSSGNQIPRAGSGPVKLGANTTDFPPLNSNGNGTANNGARAGAWGREGSPANLFNSTMTPPPVPPAAGRRFEETDSIGRPVPKSFGLYNPTTGAGPAALPAQVRTTQEGTDALVDQVSKLSVTDGGK
ncbi:unnamed protein product [Rhizoctonia solani]|uniref:SUZ domain-containing protein n=1 Tax=Rhizoctonia solani TaxID=456999 RepID=A0A8H3BF41_9AGAM|nr:unnamed protein product [Rhizoctonia solani]